MQRYSFLGKYPTYLEQFKRIILTFALFLTNSSIKKYTMKTKHIITASYILLLILCSGCSDESGKENEIKDEYTVWSYINKFAHDTMSKYYLWKDEIASDLDAWNLEWSEPTAKVKKIRYKENGEEVDQWTRLYEDYTSETSDITTTYGFDFVLYRPDSYKELIAVVTLVYRGSPAEKVGLKRGDIILAMNDKAITSDNYEELKSSSSVKLLEQKSLSMNAVTMFEDPVFLDSIYHFNNKKIGYLMYNSFEVLSCDRLIDVCKRFKKEGVKEMILDLRYNSGGTSVVHQLLASMLAPEKDVKEGGLYLQRTMNEERMEEALGTGEEENQYLQAQMEWTYNGTDYAYDISDTNVGITQLYALVTSKTASASEALLVGLNPYIKVELIGEPTRGKFCGGYNLSASEWYQEQVDEYKKEGRDFYAEHPEWADWKTYVSNWGIYIVTSHFTDKNGTPLELGKGLSPVVEVQDTPFENYPLGDERETMLRAALTRAGKAELASKSTDTRSAFEKYKKVITFDENFQSSEQF